MQFSIQYKGKEVIIDIITWESTMNGRVEFYAVFTEQQETFVNFVKRTGQSIITEVASSADLTTDIKALIKERLIDYLQHLK
jgi:pyruvate/2-oxoglutarate/acetoin dehydrogenase E1 component